MSEPIFTMVIPPGTPVELGEGDGKVEAHVMGIYIKGDFKGDFYIEYQCVWFDGNTLQTEYLPAHLVQPRELEGSHKPLGFHRGTTGSPRSAT